MNQNVVYGMLAAVLLIFAILITNMLSETINHGTVAQRRGEDRVYIPQVSNAILDQAEGGCEAAGFSADDCKSSYNSIKQ